MRIARCFNLSRRVTRTLCHTVAVACIAAGTQAQSDKLYTASHNQLEVVKVVLAQEAAWNRGDMDSFLSRYKDDPDTQVILGSQARGLATIRNAFRLNFPNKESMGAIEYSGVEARELSENICLATGNYHLERSRKAGGSVDGTFTEVMQKTDKGWQIIFAVTT